MERKDEIVKLLQRHLDVSFQEVGKLVGLSKQRVHEIARDAGLKRETKPRHYRRDITVERVLELYRGNLLLKDIAETLRCNVATVRKRLRTAGIGKSECYARSMKLDWRGRGK